MMKTPFRILIDPEAKLGKRKPEFHVTAPLPKWWDYLGYGIVAAGVTFAAAYLVTPAHARDVGVMNHEARVIEVSPSIVLYGDRETRQLRSNIVRDNNRHVNDMELENLRSQNQRALEADRAYYKKLEFQRKKRGF